MMKLADKAFPFIPAAMLPAWLVTDAEWAVRNWNSLAKQMLANLASENLDHLTAGVITFGEVYPAGKAVSAWQCLLELDKKHTQLALDATRVMKEHVAVLKRYENPSGNLDLQALIVELRRVEGASGVYPYVFDRVEEELPEDQYTGDIGEFLRIGIRVAPPEGLKLRRAVCLVDPENTDPGTKPRPMTHIDIVLGYKVLLCSSSRTAPSGFTCVRFLGGQPAIHDATERSRLAQLERELEEIKVTSNLAHALRTPLSNAVAAARRINRPGVRADEAQRLSGPLLAQIDEADSLVRLLLFVNTNDALHVAARAPSTEHDEAWPTVESSMIRRQIGEALMSIFNLRTDRPRDKRTVIAMLRANGIRVPEEQGGEDVATAFHQLAERIIERDPASFVLCSTVQSLRFSSFEAAQLARTVALNLILTELVVNAVKHCDVSDPRILFGTATDGGAIRWTVENSIQMEKTVELEHRASSAKMAGAKRDALGNYLNNKAARILGWKLERVESRPGWVSHRLLIPFERRSD